MKPAGGAAIWYQRMSVSADECWLSLTKAGGFDRAEQSGPGHAGAGHDARTLLALTSLNLNMSFHNHTIGVKSENTPRRATVTKWRGAGKGAGNGGPGAGRLLHAASALRLPAHSSYLESG